jgi:hypothetical protein
MSKPKTISPKSFSPMLQSAKQDPPISSHLHMPQCGPQSYLHWKKPYKKATSIFLASIATSSASTRQTHVPRQRATSTKRGKAPTPHAKPRQLTTKMQRQAQSMTTSNQCPSPLTMKNAPMNATLHWSRRLGWCIRTKPADSYAHPNLGTIT